MNVAVNAPKLAKRLNLHPKTEHKNIRPRLKTSID